ncbi:Membrane-bound O-acyltransferase domain-containing protein 2 [Taenia solium]|eukprot:TsM_000981400 transcript=TsM_000981400 gene=TsM_000981400
MNVKMEQMGEIFFANLLEPHLPHLMTVRSHLSTAKDITSFVPSMVFVLRCLDAMPPLMVLVQRLTLLAANLVDGHEIIAASKKKNVDKEGPLYSNGHIPEGSITSKLTPIQKEYAVLQMPTPVEFFSYCINFQTVLAGPPLAFKDYKVYIEGTEADDKHLTTKQRAEFPDSEEIRNSEQKLLLTDVGYEVRMHNPDGWLAGRAC